MEQDKKIVKQAYLYLKNYAYYDNLNLFLKQRIAQFENEENFEIHFDEIVDCVRSIDLDNSSILQCWLKAIDFHLLPKHVKLKNKPKQQEGLFISNIREEESYSVSSLNYFISAPVELHIVDMLWCLYVGPVLESKISKDNYGNRMSESALRFSENTKQQVLFKYFINQYNQWRDQAISIASNITENSADVALLSLDLSSYFYNIDLDLNAIDQEIMEYYKDNTALPTFLTLNQIIKKIYTTYLAKISEYLQLTHPDLHIPADGGRFKKGLPIGLASSAIIANWYLCDFDTAIRELVNPIYYGRYVDDILIVIENASVSNENDTIDTFIKDYFEGILFKGNEANEQDESKEDNTNYYIKINQNCLPIQKNKLILQFYDGNHSRAGLDIFKKELDERSSAFKFLPSEHIHKELEQFAYDILYEGSPNKLRSIVGIAENETELAKYLASHITAHRLCKIDDKHKVLNQIKLFFKGKNALHFFRLWEKIFQYAIVIKEKSFINLFYQYIKTEIIKIECNFNISDKEKNLIQSQIHDDLRQYSQLSLGISLGLINIENSEFQQDTQILKFARQFRQANFIRHHLVAWPLINYTDYQDDLTNEEEFLNTDNHLLNEKKLEYSPRFIHFDEIQLFNQKEYVSKNELYKWIKETIKWYDEKILQRDSMSTIIKLTKNKKGKIKKHNLKIKAKLTKTDSLSLAIANLKVNESDIKSAFGRDQKPNLSFQRQEELYLMLNSALKEKADIFILPEVSIPVSWLPFMVSFARRHQIGLIFGLEHWVINNRAYNLIIEALPFKISSKYKNCLVTARIKNHYAPKEKEHIEKLHLKVGNEQNRSNAFYHKVLWRGVSFASYNCFELADITHRVLFKSEIDLLIACVWNKDTNYYQHILESAVRDLHCYTVLSNTSQYGGSCVLRPTKTENKTMLYVKGGDNACILTTHLDIEKLRKFQSQSEQLNNDEFKPLPPGHKCKKERRR